MEAICPICKGKNTIVVYDYPYYCIECKNELEIEKHGGKLVLEKPKTKANSAYVEIQKFLKKREEITKILSREKAINYLSSYKTNRFGKEIK